MQTTQARAPVVVSDPKYPLAVSHVALEVAAYRQRSDEPYVVR